MTDTEECLLRAQDHAGDTEMDRTGPRWCGAHKLAFSLPYSVALTRGLGASLSTPQTLLSLTAQSTVAEETGEGYEGDHGSLHSFVHLPTVCQVSKVTLTGPCPHGAHPAGKTGKESVKVLH